MSDLTITVDDAEVLALLDRISGENLRAVLRRACAKIAQHARSLLMRYPGPPVHPVRWASDKQRRWWFASRREAGLPPFYTRISDPWSQRLKESWYVKETDAGAFVGTPCTYAKWVMAKETQTAQHQATGWRTTDDVANEVAQSGVPQRIAAAEIEAVIG